MSSGALMGDCFRTFMFILKIGPTASVGKVIPGQGLQKKSKRG